MFFFKHAVYAGVYGGGRGVVLRPGGSRRAGGDLVKWRFLRRHPLRTSPCVGGSHKGYVLKVSHPLILRINEVCICVRHEVAQTRHTRAQLSTVADNKFVIYKVKFSRQKNMGT